MCVEVRINGAELAEVRVERVADVPPDRGRYRVQLLQDGKVARDGQVIHHRACSGGR